MVYAATALSWYLLGRKAFTREGFLRAAQSFVATDLDVDLQNRNFVVTGGNSGIGLCCAMQLAQRGAQVMVLCRDQRRGTSAVEQITKTTGNPNVHLFLCDISDFPSIRRFVENIETAGTPIHGLINNAGCMVNDRRSTAEGYDVNLATNVLGTFLLTELLIPALTRGAPSRVVTVSSGGMLTETLNVEDMHCRKWPKYNGTRAYARQKRMQVALGHFWTDKYAATGISFHTMHPGWADTPAVQTSMPDFYEKNKTILRTSEQGADTAVWLAISPAVAKLPSGNFYLDRQVAEEHISNDTKYDPANVPILYNACLRMCGLDERVTPQRVQELHLAMLGAGDSLFGTVSQGFKSYKSCNTGSKILDWITTLRLVLYREEAVELLQQMNDEARLLHVNLNMRFSDSSQLYKIQNPPDNPMNVISEEYLSEKLAMMNSPGWTLASHTATPVDTDVYVHDVPSSKLKAVKVITTINAPMDAILDLMHTRLVERHLEWNATYDGGYVVKHFDENASIQLWRYKPGNGVSPRDFLVAHRHVTLPNGAFVLFDRSCFHPGVLEDPDYVRCDLPYNVRHFAPLESGGYTLTYLNLTDLKGWLPDWMVNWANPSVSVEEINHIREAVLKNRS